jgi:hypothetical protein
MVKGILGLVAGVLAAIVAANLAFNATANVGTQPVNEPWAQDRMEIVAWNNEKWTAWVVGDVFNQLPENKGRWSRHLNPSVAFTDWEGEMWQAKIDGDDFLLAYRGDWNGPIERSDAIRYRDWAGNNQLRTVTQLRR